MIRLLHSGPRPTCPSDVRTRYQTTGDSSCAPEMLTLFKLVNPKPTLSPLFFSGETTVKALDWSPFPPPSADCSTLAPPLGNCLFSGSHQLASLVPQFSMNTLYFKTVRNWLHVTTVEAWEDEEWEPWSKSPRLQGPLVFALLCVPALFLSPSESRFLGCAALDSSALPSDGALGWQVCSNPAFISYCLRLSLSFFLIPVGKKIWAGKKKTTVQPWVSCLLIGYSQKVGWTRLTEGKWEKQDHWLMSGILHYFFQKSI